MLPWPPVLILLAVLAVVAPIATGTAAHEATPAAVRVVPAPTECRVAPRSPASVLAFTTLPHPHPSPPAASPTPAAASAGQPADPAAEAVTATARELVACLNAGDVLRRLALFSDAGLGRFVAVYGLPPGTELLSLNATPAPTPLPANQRVSLVAVRDVLVLADGRVGATVVQDAPADPRPEEPFVAVFVLQGGRWLVDDVVILDTNLANASEKGVGQIRGRSGAKAMTVSAVPCTRRHFGARCGL